MTEANQNSLVASPSVEIPNSRKEPKPQDDPGPGLLSAQEYRNRRSRTLLEKPEAVLNQQHEIQKYFDTQPPTYREEIKRLSQLDHPMNPNCRMVITIPAYNEGTRIKNTLDQYARQDIDPSLFEIVIMNKPAENDATTSEVEAFQKEHPAITVIFAEKTFDDNEPATIGNQRKYAADIALARMLVRGEIDDDTILVFNDADTVSLATNYLSSILADLDKNPSQDAVTTKLSLPDYAMSKPNVNAAFSALETFGEIFATGEVGPDHEKISEPASTNGSSTAVRADIYAAIGGINPYAKYSEDWELGWMIADARDWDPNCIQYSTKTLLLTDPRRYLLCNIQRVPADQQLMDFEINPAIRSLDNRTIASRISEDTLDWELFQDDLDSMWRSNVSGSNRRIGKRRFELIFRAAMDRLGVQYEIDDNNGVVLKNVDKMLEQLSRPDKQISIIHSQPRVYTEEMKQNIGNFFLTIKGVVETRNAKAENVAAEIIAAESRGDHDKITDLKKAYERFAGKDYQLLAVD